MSNLQDVQRFDWEIEDNHYYCAPNKYGEWCKFDDAKEAKILQSGEASVQQLKAEIAAIATEFDRLGPGSCGGEHLKSFYNLVIKLRQLSAV